MDKLKILAIAFVYNEIKFIKYKTKWAKEQDVDLYIVDNMSNDGTWEYLQENQIPSHRVDTEDSFDLRKLQKEVLNVIHELKPDWVIYHGADLFFFTENGLRKDIESAHKKGYESISLRHLEVRNTGELLKPNDNIFEVYYHGSIEKYLTMIVKYNDKLNLRGDNFINNKTMKIPKGILVNYGMTKSKQERIETLSRRKKAWERGMSNTQGKHYEIGEKVNWKWDRKFLHNFKFTEYAYFLDIIRKYQNN